MSWRCSPDGDRTPRDSWPARGTGRFGCQLEQHSLGWVCIPPDAAVGPIKLPQGWFGQQAPLCPCSCFLGQQALGPSSFPTTLALRWRSQLPGAEAGPVPDTETEAAGLTPALVPLTPLVPSWGCHSGGTGNGAVHFPAKDGARWRDRIPTSLARAGRASRAVGTQLPCGSVAASAPPRSPACLLFP